MKKRLLIKTLSLLITAILLLEAFPYTTETKAYNADSDRIIVSLGDSFSSGEGIPEFYGQKDENGQDYDIAVKVKNEDWLAHRSTKSWPGRLTLDGVDGTMAENRNTHWFFAAVSGAETKHLKNKQNKDYNKKFSTIEGTKKLPAQLDIFNTLKSKNLKADYVTITIGGNDAGFADIISDTVISHSSYLYPGVLTKRINQTTAKFLTYDLIDTLTINPNLTPQEHLLSNFEITNVEFAESGSIYTGLCQAYEDIHEAAGDQAKIIVAGYPKLLNNASAKTINSDEVDLINNAVSLFNYGIEKLVTRYRDTENMPIYFVSVEEAFEGHEAYSLNSAINPVILFPLPEDIDDRLIRILDKKGNANSLAKYPNPSAYSMHPNEYGAKLYAECVQAKIKELEKNNSNTQSTTQQQSNNTSDSFYNNQFYQQQQYNMQIGTWNMLYDIAYDDSSVYYNTNSDNTHQINSADDIFSLKYNSGIITNTSTDSAKKEIYAAGNCAVTDSHIYYTNTGQICRLSKTNNTNVTNDYPGTSAEEIIYQFDGETPTKYILSKKYIYILDGANLLRFNHDGSNKSIISTALTSPTDYFGMAKRQMFTINDNLYFNNKGKLYCYNSSTEILSPLFNISDDVEFMCASGNALYFSKTELYATNDLDDQYTTTVFKYTEGDSDLEGYMSFVTYGSGDIFVDPSGAVYIAHTHGGGTPVSKFVNGIQAPYNGEAFSADCGLYIYKNQIIGFDFMGEKIICAYTF